MSHDNDPQSDVSRLRRRADTLQTELDHRRQSEERLTETIVEQTRKVAESNELVRHLVESVIDYAIYMLDPAGNIATWNAGAARIKGYSAAEIIGKHFSTFYPEADIRAGICDLELEIAARDGRFEAEGWRLRKDGSRFWAHVVITAVRAEGKLVGYAKVTRDLSIHRRAEDERAARLAAEERFRLLVASVRDYAIFMLDAKGIVQTWNAGAERIKGFTATDIIGSHFSRFYPESDVLAGKCELELAIATRVGRFEDEGWRVRKDGTMFWANVVISRVDNDQGTLVGFSKVTRDLTERRHVEEERAARVAAEQANRTKDEFLAMLGHELRNPLAPIVTALQLMKLRGDDRSLREQQIIERQVKHMINLVDDLLDVERITRGHIELKQQVLNVRDPIARAIESVSPLLEQRGHHLDVRIPERALNVRGDEARLTQVFTNLITNAAKYTDPGGHISVDLATIAGEIIIEVRDDGIGIEPALLPNVFDLFVQGSRSSERAGGGLGLGLTLVRSIVALHGGTVTAQSEGRGMGCCFTVRLAASSLPVDKRTTEPGVPALPIPDTKRRILLVDDNDDALLLLCDLLVSVGYEVRTAGDALAALELVKDFTPDVAILDIGLPVVDGYELASRLRSELATAMPRLIALTGYGQEVDQARSRDAGFDVHLVKPVDVERLLASIAN